MFELNLGIKSSIRNILRNFSSFDLLNHSLPDLISRNSETSEQLSALEEYFNKAGERLRANKSWAKERIALDTNKPVAHDSPDHVTPWGTMRDNSKNYKFNLKLCSLYESAGNLSVLDLGCSGGGFVKSILDAGFLSVGVEGSDYSKTRKRAEWATIPNYLFTADIAEPFTVHFASSSAPIKFKVITSWEVLEHIQKDKLPVVLENVRKHLDTDGIFVSSISMRDDIINGVNLHQTVEGKPWWLEFFKQHGFTNDEKLISYFDADWIRCEKNAEGSFHVVLRPA